MEDRKWRIGNGWELEEGDGGEEMEIDKDITRESREHNQKIRYTKTQK